MISCMPWKASTTASQGEVLRRWRQVSEQLFLLDIFRCKEDIPSKGNGCPVAMYFIFQGPIWICRVLQEKMAAKICGKIWRYHFFIHFFLAETIQLSFPLKQLGIRLKAPGCTEYTLRESSWGWKVGALVWIPSALLLCNWLIFSGRNYFRSIQFSVRHRSMHKSTFESQKKFSRPVLFEIFGKWNRCQNPLEELVPGTSHSLLGAFSIYSKYNVNDFSSSGLWALEAKGSGGTCRFLQKSAAASYRFEKLGEELVHWKWGIRMIASLATPQSKFPDMKCFFFLNKYFSCCKWLGGLVQSLAQWITQKRQPKYRSTQCQAMIMYHYLYDTEAI